ncbi:hypothetical protein Tsubulata_029082 [Turnera subulata]|uniref:Uncharacterized protein n=1 Tax=Turnera subulata TaxID=218843 RepID=A0A9Q0GJ76_9ROSI|nr:hypothetical protein Tsubulata_029082 [Turnera subulata]
MEGGGDILIEGSVDYKGQPAHRSNSGGWRSASFVIAVEVAERFACNGISANLIMYFTGPLGQSTATAAQNVNAWSGTATLLPLLGAFVADSFLGRYRTIILASLIYVLGLGLLTVSATLTSLHISSHYPPWSHQFLFYFSLYLLAVAQGGHKPCLQAFGADQFDGRDPEEAKAKSSFFNWWNFNISVGSLFTVLVSVYIQDNLGWSLGFGIPFAVVLFSLLIFLLGSRTYRYSLKRNEKNPFIRMCRVVFITIGRKWSSIKSGIAIETEASMNSFEQFNERSLNKPLLEVNGAIKDQRLCSIRDVEEAKALMKLMPIWVSCLAIAVVSAQASTFFTKQAATMDRRIVFGLQIPAASVQSFGWSTAILFIPIYDRILVPASRALTGKSSGITMLQRIGTGLVIASLCMISAALVEKKRLKTAEEYGLANLPNETIPLSVWWLVPQYVLCGVASVFTNVGLQEFFYDQVPKDIRSVGASLYLSVFGVGNFLSGFLVSIIDKSTSGDGQDGWFCHNINQAHLDYFYWLLAALTAVGFISYLYFARSYIYNRESMIS